jgi:CheY-like chemotaxis protein
MNKPYVIVADDDDDQRELLRLRLRREGFVVETAADGRELLGLIDRAAGASDRPPVALIISDLMMPECSGWDVLAALRRRGLGVPVLVVSAVADLGSYSQALALGARAVLRKPFEWAELRDAIFRALGTNTF